MKGEVAGVGGGFLLRVGGFARLLSRLRGGCDVFVLLALEGAFVLLGLGFLVRGGFGVSSAVSVRGSDRRREEEERNGRERGCGRRVM